MKFLLLPTILLAMTCCQIDARAQGGCRGGGGAPMAGRALRPETSGAATIALAYPEIARQQTISLAYEARQRYLINQYRLVQEQMKTAHDAAQEEAEAKQRKIEAIKERRLAAMARRDAAKSKRLKALESASALKTAALNRTP